ncbi:hypothetical protein BBP40_001763 [Aspergillus hancockii]|nr:hypothetical protein BBP40_001763 [Aspergillus hancockii]
MHTPSIAQGLLVAISLVSFADVKLGINCRGSANCNTIGNTQMAIQLTHVIDNIDINRWYYNGEHVACVGSSAHHRCKACGSVPYYFPQGNNNVDDGELTYNFVDNACTKDEAKLC